MTRSASASSASGWRRAMAASSGAPPPSPPSTPPPRPAAPAAPPPPSELDVAVRAVAGLAVRRPELPVHLDLYGRGDSQPALEALRQELGIADRLTFHGRIPIEDVPAAIARADVGLAPTRRDPFTDASLSTKILEYAAMRRPEIGRAHV